MTKATSLPHAVDLERLEHTDDPGGQKLRSHTVCKRLNDWLCATVFFPIDWSRTVTPSSNLCSILVRKTDVSRLYQHIVQCVPWTVCHARYATSDSPCNATER